MKGIVVPERTEDFTADPVELFFDLAYVFAFSQLVGHLIGNHDWEGAGEAGLLFMVLWLPWSQFTWAANAVSGNGRAVRAIFLVATAVSIPMAASVSTALDDGGPVFAVCVGVIVALGLALQGLALDRGTSLHQAWLRWSTPSLAAIAVLIIGSAFDGAARVVLWIGMIVIIILAMVLAGRQEWIVRSGHFAERHGLIVIIALGEVIVAIGIPVVRSLEAGAGLSSPTVLALLGSGVFAALLWWSYFDRPSPAVEHRAEGIVDVNERGRFVRDVYTWAHLPIVAGVILAAAALEEIALHPEDEVPDAFRLMLWGGLALFSLGIAAAVWRSFGAIARERVVMIVAVAAVVAIGESWDGAVLLLVIDALVAVGLVVEHARIER